MSQVFPRDIKLDGSFGPGVTLGKLNVEIGEALGKKVVGQNGVNLFHSFQRFNVREGGSATFTGAHDISNIVSRVTGIQDSLINGRLASSIVGANFFLLNPNGVIFGSNASLDINGSFYVSTANEIRLADGNIFKDQPGLEDLLLTSEPPVAFGFLGLDPPNLAMLAAEEFPTAGITVKELNVINSKSIALIGRDAIAAEKTIPGIEIMGRTFQNKSGVVNIVSVAAPGNVVIDNIQEFQGTNFQTLGEIKLLDSPILGGGINVSGAGNGAIIIRGGKLTLDNASLLANKNGTQPGESTAIDLFLTERVDLKNSRLTAKGQNGSTGKVGNIEITTGILTMDNSTIDSGLFFGSQAKGNNLTITAGRVELVNKSVIFGDTEVREKGGAIIFNVTDLPEGTILDGEAGKFTVDNSIINTETSSEGLDAGRGGSISVDAGVLELKARAQITASTLGSGNAGDITLNLGTLTALDSTISSSSTLDDPIAGSAGTIRIQGLASPAESIILSNTEISTATIDSKAGEITLDAKAIHLQNQTNVSTSATSLGEGGTITVEAIDKLITDNSTISATANNGSTSGDIALRATSPLNPENSDFGSEHILIANESRIEAESLGSASAGNITVEAVDTLRIQGNSELNTSNTNAGGGDAGGDIKLTADFLIHVLGSQISSDVRGQADTTGGNIEFDPRFVVIENSLVTANADLGGGGTITINASDAVLVDSLSNLDVGSQFGGTGTIDVNAPIQNLSGAIAPLPEETLRVAALYKGRCAAQKGGEFSSFTVRGRDRVPLEPGDFIPFPTRF